MAFEINNFSVSGSQSRKGEAPQQYTYKNTNDTKTEMLADDYFNEAAFQLNDNDSLTVIASDGLGIFHVVTSNAVTKKVVVDDDLAVSLPGTNSFENIFELSDFPTPSNDVIKVKNGVNYLVYIEGPINSPLRFELPTNYAQGGSLIYMGSQEVLVWNVTGTGTLPFIEGDGLIGGNFLIKGFSVENLENNADSFIDISGQSNVNPFEFLRVENTRCVNFKGGVLLDHVHEVDIDELIVFMNTGKTQDSPGLQINKVLFAEIHNSVLTTSETDIEILNISSAPSGAIMQTFSASNVSFRRPTGSTTAPIVYQPIVEPLGFATFDNCQSLLNGVINNLSFTIEAQGGIKSILTDSGGAKIKVETFTTHNLSATDTIMLWGTPVSSYNAINFTVDSVFDSTNFIIDETFVTNARSGFFRKGGFDGFSTKNILVNGCLGFENSVTQGSAQVTESTENQIIGSIGTFQTIVFAEGEVIQPAHVILRDIFIPDLNKLSLKNDGPNTIHAKVTLSFIVFEEIAAAYKIRFAIGSRFSQEWVFDRDPTSALGYTFSTYMQMNPGDVVEAQVAQATGTLDNVIFTTALLSVDA